VGWVKKWQIALSKIEKYNNYNYKGPIHWNGSRGGALNPLDKYTHLKEITP